MVTYNTPANTHTEGWTINRQQLHSLRSQEKKTSYKKSQRFKKKKSKEIIMSVSMKYGTTFSRRLLQLMSPVRATTANTRQLAVDSATNRRPKYRDWVYFGAVATIVSSVFYKVHI